MLIVPNRDGNIAIWFALMAVPIIGVVMATLGISKQQAQTHRIQAALDAAVMDAARAYIDEFRKSDPQIEQVIKKRLDTHAYALKDTFLNLHDTHIDIDIDSKTHIVQVSLESKLKNDVLPIFGKRYLPVTFTTSAEAVMESKPVCILALERKGRAIAFAGKGKVEADDCVIWSNSRGSRSISFEGRGDVETERLCTVGRSGSVDRFDVNPAPEEGCQRVDNPMREWPGVPVPACDFTSHTHIDTSLASMRPGVYCGGLTIDVTQSVTFDGGLYIIKDGPLIIRGKRDIRGRGVGFYLTGTNTSLEVNGDTDVDLSAMTSGPMAGIIFAIDPASIGSAWNGQASPNKTSHGANSKSYKDSARKRRHRHLLGWLLEGLFGGYTPQDVTDSSMFKELGGTNNKKLTLISGRTDLRIGGVIYLPDRDLIYWGDSDTEAESPVTTIISNTLTIGGEAYLNVRNSQDEAKYAPILETGHGDVRLVK